jgi:hypothetical protein
MSELKVNSIVDANSGNTTQINGMTPTADSLQGFRNRVINGDMVIDQRNAGAAVTTSLGFAVDRFQVANNSDGAFSAQQDSSAPAGFVNSLKITTTTADGTLTTTQGMNVQQKIEGYNVADLGWGTANAKTVTLSFWVRSSLTGTFGASLQNSTPDRSYPFSYSISSANTWEYKTVTIAGDTTGTWLNTNGVGLRIVFGLGVGPDRSGTAGAWTGSSVFAPTGAVSVIGTLSATWQITGVQLEAGSVATPFERRPFGAELALCQRYYYKIQATGTSCLFGNALNASVAESRGMVFSKVPMRTAPTALEQSGTAADYRVQHLTTNTTCNVVPSFSGGEVDNFGVNFFVVSGLTAGQASLLRSSNANAFLAWSAEL